MVRTTFDKLIDKATDEVVRVKYEIFPGKPEVPVDIRYMAETGEVYMWLPSKDMADVMTLDEFKSTVVGRRILAGACWI